MKIDTEYDQFNKIGLLKSIIGYVQNGEALITMMDNVNLGCLLVNPHKEIIWINNALKILFPPICACKKPLYYEFLHFIVQIETSNYCPALMVFKTGKAGSAENVFCVNGRRYNIISTPIEDRDDKVIYVLETFFDITNPDQDRNESE
ncbi:MAG: hypothetical protein ACUZ8O_15130 [Candidatus Anammoxibacter sp.]